MDVRDAINLALGLLELGMPGLVVRGLKLEDVHPRRPYQLGQDRAPVLDPSHPANQRGDRRADAPGAAPHGLHAGLVVLAAGPLQVVAEPPLLGEQPV